MKPGDRCGLLRLVRREPDERRGQYWRCACDCGGSTVVRADNLKPTGTQSCGCLRSIVAKRPKSAGLAGTERGKLQVLRRVPDPRRGVYYLCRCACGGSCRVRADALLAGQESCGCKAAPTVTPLVMM